MVQRPMTRFYPTYAEAVQVVADLTAGGISTANINVIESEDDARLPVDLSDYPSQDPFGVGATLGTAIGAGVGVLAGVGAITLPLADSMVQSGWIAPCLVFAVIGCAVGTAIGLFVRIIRPKRLAQAIAEGLQRGHVLVMVRAGDLQVHAVEAIFNRPHSPPPPAIGEIDDYQDTSTEAAVAAIRREEHRIQYE